MSVLVEFAMFPTDHGESKSLYVSRVIEMFKKGDISYKLTPMGTIFETDTFESATKVLQQAYAVLEPDCNRVYSTVTFDIRKGHTNRMKNKIASIESKIGEVNK
jgi:uncharacterized protein (TIGR00106 family)